MTRYIDADAIEFPDANYWEETHEDEDYGYGMGVGDCIEIIEKMPTVDAEPVRHGKWKNDCMGVLRCSECNTQAPWKYGKDYIDYRWKANYCPNCGARMDEE